MAFRESYPDISDPAFEPSPSPQSTTPRFSIAGQRPATTPINVHSSALDGFRSSHGSPSTRQKRQRSESVSSEHSNSIVQHQVPLISSPEPASAQPQRRPPTRNLPILNVPSDDTDERNQPRQSISRSSREPPLQRRLTKPSTSPVTSSPPTPSSTHPLKPALSRTQSQPKPISTASSSKEPISSPHLASALKLSPNINIDLPPLLPPSTWRHYTHVERTIALSIERERAQDLARHLYNAYALRKAAEKAGVGRRRSRSQSQIRSQSRGRKVSHARSQSRSRKEEGKGKGKGKARANIGDKADEEEHNHNNNQNTISTSPAEHPHPPLEPQNGLAFNPPRFWTAWPLPPSEVPRPELLPTTLLGGDGSHVYRRRRDPRPSADLEECLLAITARIAKEMWEAREWESSDNETGDADRPKKRMKGATKKKKNKKQNMVKTEGRGGKVGIDLDVTDVEMQDTDRELEDGEQGMGTGSSDDIDSSPIDSSDEEGRTYAHTDTHNDDGNDIPLFSSQAFMVASPSLSQSPPPSSSSSSSTSSSASAPVFLADDDRLRQLLLPSTRHIISQFDDLLRALHRVHANTRRKAVEPGGRGANEVLGIADLFFSRDVVQQAKERCGRLFGDGDAGL